MREYFKSIMEIQLGVLASEWSSSATGRKREKGEDGEKEELTFRSGDENGRKQNARQNQD